MKYALRNGYSVITAKLPGERTEFTTNNEKDELVSVVVKERKEARELVISLRTAVCLRRGA